VFPTALEHHIMGMYIKCYRQEGLYNAQTLSEEALKLLALNASK
jgi:hypothetical protein